MKNNYDLLSRMGNVAEVNLRLFTSPEDYYSKCDVDVRTQHRKASKVGFKINQLFDITPLISTELYSIWTSSDVRQNRPINLQYETIETFCLPILPERWPVKKYDGPLSFYAMEMDVKIVAYVELYTQGTTAVVHSTLGHFDYLKYGIMKALFYEIIKLKWNEINTIVYGSQKDLNYFKKDLLFK